MKILFILPDRFPHSGACSSLLLKMLTEGALAEKLGDVHILVPKYNKEDPSIETIENVIVHRALFPSFFPAVELRKMKNQPAMLLRGLVAKLLDRKLPPRLRKCGFLQGCFTKDIQRSIQRLHAKENFQVLIPIAGAYEMVAAAMVVAKKEKIGLLVYQVDPCSTNASYDKKSQRSRELFEDELYLNADAVITTPIILAERQATGKPDLKKTTAMEFPNVSVKPIFPSTRKDANKKICVFAGRLYRGIRDPKYTVSLFAHLADQNIQLHMYGVTTEELLSYDIDKNAVAKIFCHGLSPLNVVHEKISQADVVVNIGNVMTNQVPSKIFEYISSCKPIINIAANSNCPSIPYLRRYPRVLTLLEDEGIAKESICSAKNFIIENAGLMVEQEVVLKSFRECTAVYCAEVMASEIKKICTKNGG